MYRVEPHTRHRALLRQALVVFAALTWAHVPMSAEAQGVHVALSPIDSVVALGDQFDVRVEVTTAGDPFNAYQTVIEFDPAALTYIPQPTSQQEGSLMASQCGSTFKQFVHDAGSDSIKITHALLCANTSVTGPGVLYKIRFQAQASHSTNTEIRFRWINFANAGLAVGPVDSTNASLILGNPTDATWVLPVTHSIHVSPNPFNPNTTVRVESLSPGHERLLVHDVRGRLVRVLEEGYFGSGSRYISWDGNDERGRAVPSGRYLVTLMHTGGQLTQPVVLMK